MGCVVASQVRHALLAAARVLHARPLCTRTNRAPRAAPTTAAVSAAGNRLGPGFGYSILASRAGHWGRGQAGLGRGMDRLCGSREA